MNTDYITCPKCSHKIPLSKAMTHQVQEEVERDYQAKLDEELKARDKELKEKEERLKARYEKEREEEYQKLKEDAAKKAKRQYDNQLKEQETELSELDKELKKSRKKEKEFLQQKIEFEKELHENEIQLMKKIEKETQKIRKQESASAQERYTLQLREKEKIIDDLRKKMEEGTKKAEQGSMQLQGEVQELELEHLLKKHFPQDDILAVKTGQRGGDIIQVVKTKNGTVAGKILWESKRTKNWNQGWTKKLKEDMQHSKCDLGAIVTEVLPEQIAAFGLLDGVWITNLKLSIGLAVALRQNLQNIYTLKIAIENQSEKKEVIYNYLTGSQFKNRVEAIVEAVSTMQMDLNAEKRAMEKIWAKRDKQIEVFIKNMSGIYGDLQGSGAALAPIKVLELPDIGATES